MGRVGVLDLGTNTFRLLIAHMTPPHKFERDLIERRIVRIGEGFVGRANISEEPAKRAKKVLKKFSALFRRQGVDRIQAVATGVFRDAENADQIIKDLSRRVTCPVRIITGVEEGIYTLKGIQAGTEIPGDSVSLIIDIGGGSTEFIRVDRKGEVEIQSIPVGVVYLKEKFEHLSSSRNEAMLAIQQWVDRSLEEMIPLIQGSSPLVCIGTGGTITTLSYMDLGMKKYDPEIIHGARLTGKAIEHLLSDVRGCSTDKIRKRFFLEKGRADLVLYGAVLVLGILKRLPDPTLRVSDYGLLEGIAVEMLENDN
jgi:exopolyphosphatase/guanosine-5'-triphosphate,3'-diphosphate pyrophosphatase